jgi:uncharacterized protein
VQLFICLRGRKELQPGANGLSDSPATRLLRLVKQLSWDFNRDLARSFRHFSIVPYSLPALSMVPHLWEERRPGLGTSGVPPSADKLVSSMAISERLLEILVCPLCKAKVVLKEDGSGLKCVACHRVYPVRDDIPIMMVDQATIEA